MASRKTVEVPRNIIITSKDLEDIDSAYSARWDLCVAMMFPESDENQNRFLKCIDRLALSTPDKDARTEFVKALPEYSAELMGMDLQDCQEFIDGTVYSRKKGATGSLVVRGALAGQTLHHLAMNENVYSLKDAYDTLRKYHSTPKEFLQEYIKERNVSNQNIPTNDFSESILKAVWSEYKHVAHYWAADHVYTCMTGKIFTDPLDFSADSISFLNGFRMFIGIASFFREHLRTARHPVTNIPLIKDESLLWDIVNECDHPYPPAYPTAKISK